MCRDAYPRKVLRWCWRHQSRGRCLNPEPIQALAFAAAAVVPVYLRYRSRDGRVAILRAGIGSRSDRRGAFCDHAVASRLAPIRYSPAWEPVTHRSAWRPDQTEILPLAAPATRNSDDLFRPQHRAAGWVWQLPVALADRRTGNGLPAPQYGFLLAHCGFVACVALYALRFRRTSSLWMDCLRTLKCGGGNRRARRRLGANTLACLDRHLLCCVRFERCDLHRHDGALQNSRHEFRAIAPHDVGVAGDGLLDLAFIFRAICR